MGNVKITKQQFKDIMQRVLIIKSQLVSFITYLNIFKSPLLL